CRSTPRRKQKATPQPFLDRTDKLWWLLLHNNQSGRRSASSRRRRDLVPRSLCKRSERRSAPLLVRPSDKPWDKILLQSIAFPLFQRPRAATIPSNNLRPAIALARCRLS